MQVACGGRERLGSGFSSHKPPEGTSSAHTLIYPGEADFGASDPPDREETCVLAPKSAVMCQLQVTNPPYDKGTVVRTTPGSTSGYQRPLGWQPCSQLPSNQPNGWMYSIQTKGSYDSSLVKEKTFVVGARNPPKELGRGTPILQLDILSRNRQPFICQNRDSPGKAGTLAQLPNDELLKYLVNSRGKRITSADFTKLTFIDSNVIDLKNPGDTISGFSRQSPGSGVYHQIQRPKIIPKTA